MPLCFGAVEVHGGQRAPRKGGEADLRAGLGTPNLICAPRPHDMTANGLLGLHLFVWAHAAVVKPVNLGTDLGILLQQ